MYPFLGRNFSSTDSPSILALAAALIPRPRYVFGFTEAQKQVPEFAEWASSLEAKFKLHIGDTPQLPRPLVLVQQ